MAIIALVGNLGDGFSVAGPFKDGDEDPVLDIIDDPQTVILKIKLDEEWTKDIQLQLDIEQKKLEGAQEVIRLLAPIAGGLQNNGAPVGGTIFGLIGEGDIEKLKKFVDWYNRFERFAWDNFPKFIGDKLKQEFKKLVLGAE